MSYAFYWSDRCGIVMVQLRDFNDRKLEPELTTTLPDKSLEKYIDMELLEYYCRANAPNLVLYDASFKQKYIKTNYKLLRHSNSFKISIVNLDGVEYPLNNLPDALYRCLRINNLYNSNDFDLFF